MCRPFSDMLHRTHPHQVPAVDSSGACEELIYLGVTHRTAPLCIREAFCVDRAAARTMYLRLSSLASGRMVLSTCERFEMYLTASADSLHPLLQRISQWFHVPPNVLRSHVQVRTELDAARHLLSVSAGLESRIVGEDHVLGQFRRAYLHALESGSLGPTLAALGRFALRTGKRARSETGINAGRESIASITVDHLHQALLPRGSADVLVLGSGDIASAVLMRLRSRSIRPIRTTVTARNLDRANELAARAGAGAVPWTELMTAIASADAVVACTGAATFVLDAAAVAAVMRTRRHRPLLTIDLGMPRNIDPACVRIPGVTRMDLAELKPAALHDQAARGAADRIVGQELEAFARWRRERRAAPCIAALFERERRDRDHIPLDARRRLHPCIVRLKAEAVT